MGSTVHQKYIDIGFIFEKDAMGKQECIGYVDSDYARNLDKHQFTTGYVLTLSQAPMSWLCSTVYCHIVY